MQRTSASGYTKAAQHAQRLATPPPREWPQQMTREGVRPPDRRSIMMPMWRSGAFTSVTAENCVLKPMCTRAPVEREG